MSRSTALTAKWILLLSLIFLLTLNLQNVESRSLKYYEDYRRMNPFFDELQLTDNYPGDDNTLSSYEDIRDKRIAFPVDVQEACPPGQVQDYSGQCTSALKKEDDY